jgi:hypothetical protein
MTPLCRDGQHCEFVTRYDGPRGQFEKLDGAIYVPHWEESDCTFSPRHLRVLDDAWLVGLRVVTESHAQITLEVELAPNELLAWAQPIATHASGHQVNT